MENSVNFISSKDAEEERVMHSNGDNLEDPLTMLVHSNHHGCFDLFSWLHHDEEKVAVFFFTCLKAEETKSLSTCSVSQGDAFTKVDTL